MDLVTRSGTLPGSDEARDFVGNDRLRLTAIHHAPEFTTEWLEQLPSDQSYWSSENPPP